MGDSSGCKVRFSIDRGGTFTDVYGELCSSDGNVLKCTVLKLLSEDPDNYQDAPREGIRRVLEEFFETPHPRDVPLDTSRIESIRMGTTVATNALLERKGERFALVTTKGYKDVWHIGNQSRPNIFDLKVECPETLYDCVEEIDERVLLATSDALDCFPDAASAVQDAVTGEKVFVEQAVDKEQVRAMLTKLKAEKGINSVAVVLMHSAIYPEHEKIVGEIAKEVGIKQISLSHQVMQMVKIVPRGFTASADAYLTPHIGRYLNTFMAGFDEHLKDRVFVSFMQSDGGLTHVDRFSGHKAVLSGPAGGVVGYALTSRLAEGAPDADAHQVVGFDMGGTSTDVSRFAGHYDHVFETITAGVTIQAPQLDISTVAAGGGSRLTYSSGVFQVGPESVGAHPGPVCYRKGGNLAVTDANLMLGRVLPEYFPHIFGPNENEPLDAKATQEAFAELTKIVNKDSHPDVPAKTPEEVAFGFITVANEAMCRPIRNLTQMRGFDLAKHTLSCFGGAGGQHACAIARALGMRKVFVHRYASILSAYGIGLADVVDDTQEPCALVITLDGNLLAAGPERKPTEEASIHADLDRLEARSRETLLAQGFSQEDMKFEYFLNMRYVGTDTALMSRTERKQCSLAEFVKYFEESYEREFGFKFNDREIVIDDIRVRCSGYSAARLRQENELSSAKHAGISEASPDVLETRQVYFDGGWQETPVYRLGGAARPGGSKIAGPAILLDANSTIVVEPFCNASVSGDGDVTIDIHSSASSDDEVLHVPTSADPIQLSLFSHRFMGIAEQMGRTLQRTAVSVNIKERLDFSCALFGPDGGLVANAPHIPVHLGAMQEAIRYQYRTRAGDIQEGDVLVSNHPQLAGGSHLPDITVITPCFEEGKVVFWVASRGHHADVGGITPGSMPPNSQKLADEGAAFESFKLVQGGKFQEEGVTKILTTPSNPGDPNCKGTRALGDNLSDLRAQVAANNHGARLVRGLVQEYNLPFVQAYMNFIQLNAESAVREMLRSFIKTQPDTKVVAEDFMDDGTPIKVSITIDPETGSAVFDFEGTGPQVVGNCNAPPAVTYSAIIYSLRCLVGQDIPLNEGCLAPVTVKIPNNTILNPSVDSAVVGGNVLTSQRVVDVILKAFQACAASQGCMNNLTFGDETFGYYETIAGGAGAGPTWNGRSGVHTHMTNTRITDPEIFERRYPVVLRQFGLRPNTGGSGAHPGGDGIVREVQFLRPVQVSLLTERRAFQPYGMAGGGNGARGFNLLLRHGSNIAENMGGKSSMAVNAGDRVRILAPGGGGYGQA